MSAPKTSARTYASNRDYRTETPGVYRRGDYFRVLTRPAGKRKVMRRFETYEEAVAFKRGMPSRAETDRSLPRRNSRVSYLLRDPCAYCGAPSETFDHIHPQALGGNHDWQNVVGACRRCNSSKQDTSLLLFLLRRLAPRIGEGDDLFSYL